jgi:hypothetical protein
LYGQPKASKNLYTLAGNLSRKNKFCCGSEQVPVSVTLPVMIRGVFSRKFYRKKEVTVDNKKYCIDLFI